MEGLQQNMTRFTGSIKGKHFWWSQAMYVLDDNRALNDDGHARQVGEDIDEVVLGAFADQRRGNATMRFRGIVYTDTVGVSILKTDVDTTATILRRANTIHEEEEFADHIQEDLAMVDDPEQPDRLAVLNANNAVLIDAAGRRDTKYGIHERHTRNRKSMFRFTRNQRNAICRVKRYRAIRRRARIEIVNINEKYLSASPSKKN